jgi:predicted permease
MGNLRFAFRQLCKSPGFTLLAMLTLGLGIGLNTSIFSIVNDLFFKSLPYAEPDRIVRIYGELAARDLRKLPFSIPRFWHYRDGQSVFSAMGADSASAVTLTSLGDPVQLNASAVTANYFDLLGVRPLLGRLFRPEEESVADVALVNESFWRSRLASDPNAAGRSITLNGVPYTIIGVLPNMPVAWFGLDLEVWTTKPFELAGYPRERLMRGAGYLRAIARLKPGVTKEQARAALASLNQSYRVANADKNDSAWTTTLVGAQDDITANLRSAFITLLAAVSFVLLIACTNVANLLLVRFNGRRREAALRMALGASRRSVVRLFITESTLVSLLAGVIGAAAAWVLIPLVPRLAPNNLPLEPHVALSWPMLVFTLVVSVVTGLGMGLYPAWQTSNAHLSEGLKDGGRAMAGGLRQQRFRRILVAAQVALSVALLSGASLLIASFVRLSHQETGFRVDNLWVGFVQLPLAHYADPASRARFADRLLKELRPLPGVQAAALSETVPLNGNGRSSYARADKEAPPPSQRPVAPTHNVSPGYFAALGIPLKAGRDFDERDTLDHPLVAVISESSAKRIYPGENPIGRPLYIGNNNGIGDRIEIIGVVGDVRTLQVSISNDVELYRPWAQDNKAFGAIAVRSAFRPDDITKLVQATLQKIDPALPIFQPQPIKRIVETSLGQAHLVTLLLGLFASIALVLATIGIYGAVAFTVAQRTGEIGVRMALGAQTGDVLRLVVSQGMKPVIAGLAVGLAVSLALGHLLAAQLYQVSPQNPVLLAGTASILALAGLLACVFPAARASFINPAQALRAE